MDYLRERHGGYYEYKVISLYDTATGSVDISQLTKTLNDLGMDGWHLVTAYSNELGQNATPGFLKTINSTIDENILIFERFIRL